MKQKAKNNGSNNNNVKERAIRKRVRKPLVIPSLCDLSRSCIVNRTTLFLVRFFSLISHIIVIITGIYTRKLRFFFQYTNWTNCISFVAVNITFYSSILGIIISKKSKMNNSIADKQKNIEETFIAPSRFAYIAQELFKISLPMHIITTTVFWLFVYPYATQRDPISMLYFYFAHGVTFSFVLLEIFLTRIIISKKVSKSIQDVLEEKQLIPSDATPSASEISDNNDDELKRKKDKQINNEIKWFLQIPSPATRADLAKSRIRTIMLISGVFCIIGIIIFYKTGWAVYPFFDLSKPYSSYPQMSSTFALIPVVYYFSASFTRFRDYVTIKILSSQLSD